jgi:hypothetical protein
MNLAKLYQSCEKRRLETYIGFSDEKKADEFERYLKKSGGL